MKLLGLAVAILAVAGGFALLPDHTFTTPLDFQHACKNTHVRFFKPPSSPVTSVLWIQEPAKARSITFHGYVIEGNKRLKTSGTAVDGWQPFLSDYVPVFKPLERTHEQRKAALPAVGFFRNYRNQTDRDTVPASFDVKVTYTIGPESALNTSGRWMPMATHSLEVFDLRTNERLAEMVYVVDRARNLACGENIPGQANMDVFVLQATNLIHIVVQPPNYRFRWVAPVTQYER